MCHKGYQNSSIHSQDIKQKVNSDVTQGPQLLKTCEGSPFFNLNLDLVNINVYITRAPHAGANAQLQFLLEIYRACLIISNRNT